jgi:CubicO group peptidase (beta-lactamase class C family)
MVCSIPIHSSPAPGDLLALSVHTWDKFTNMGCVMSLFQRRVSGTACLLLFLSCFAWNQRAYSWVDLPRVDGIIIDGNESDWRNRGHHITIMAGPGVAMPDAASLAPQVRLGWNEDGVVFWAFVHDDEVSVREAPARIMEGDCVQFWFDNSSKAIGTDDKQPIFPDTETPLLYRADVAPGNSAAISSAARIVNPSSNVPKVTVFTQIKDGGYVVEALLPWSNVINVPYQDPLLAPLNKMLDPAAPPKAGDLFRLQFAINDFDEKANRRFRCAWYPSEVPPFDGSMMHWLKLSKKSRSTENIVARGSYDQKGRSHLTMWAAEELAGSALRVEYKKDLIGQVVLEKADGRSRATLEFGLPPQNENYGALNIAGKKLKSVCIMPDTEEMRAGFALMSELRATEAVFPGENLPTFDFQDPLLTERILGPYVISTTFFDSNYGVVSGKAVAPGRYGAVIDVKFASGRTVRRFQTVYRAKGNYDGLMWWSTRPEMNVDFPPKLELDRKVVAENGVALGTYFEDATLYYLMRDSKTAAMLAGMSEMKPLGRSAARYEDALALDRQWWATLKRDLYGTKNEFRKPLVCPRPIEGAPAPELRTGSAKDAGMKPETVAALDSLLQEWSDRSGEPFATCLARKGVVFYHKAYGERNGKPMTVNTPSWMASISKFLSGTLMMTLVDQGLVDLDADIAQYLPRFRQVPVARPLHIRHLFTHTNGLGLNLPGPRNVINHWGDDMHDLEEQIAEYYPYLKVGRYHGYNGVGYALAGKIIESTTGEALPQAFHNHLYGPLGCEHTDAVDMSAHTFSVPMDIAKVGQMLLNKGAYGDKRFFSEATFEKILPTKLRETTGTPIDAMWGIGPVYMPQGGLSPKTFGHGAASSATFMIDPENELVIVMTRNTAGPMFGEYHGKFIKTIVEGLAK